MPQRWSMEWFNEFAPIEPPTFDSLVASFDAFKLKESQLSSKQGTPEAQSPDADGKPYHLPRERLAVEHFSGDYDSKVMKIAESINALIEETEYSDAVSAELGRALDQVARLTTQNEDQRLSVENYQKHLERALHTQKVLERDLEEYQQAYAELKASAFGSEEDEEDPDDIDDADSPPRYLEFGHSDYLVYPAKVNLADGTEDVKWGIVIADRDSDDDLVGKEVILQDEDVAITFEGIGDVSRLIGTLENLKHRMFVDMFTEEK